MNPLIVPPLPDELAELLDDSSPGEDSAADAQVAAFIAEHTRADHPQLLLGPVHALKDGIAEGKSRHKTAVSAVTWATDDARAGCYSAENASAALKDIVLHALANPVKPSGRRVDGEQAEAEWDGILAWAIGQTNAKTDDDIAARRARIDKKAKAHTMADNDTGAAEHGNPAVTTAEHSGQVRIAYRLADDYTDQLMHVHGLGWHYWDATRWATDDQGNATRAVLTVLRNCLAESLGDKELRADVRKCESANGINGVLAVAAALPQFAATVRDLDADPYLLNTASGTLDLRTMDLRPHSPKDRITKVTRAGLDPQAPAPTWSAFLARVLPAEPVRAYLQRLAGVGLLGKVVEHVLPILTGTGANGKGTWYKAICWALGDYASTVEPDLLMQRQGAHPTGEMDLLGRRIVVVSESDRDRRLAEATMKRLTGGDPIRARRMRQDFIEFEPSHTPLLITNYLPILPPSTIWSGRDNRCSGALQLRVFWWRHCWIARPMVTWPKPKPQSSG
jgi:hypothetical protein